MVRIFSSFSSPSFTRLQALVAGLFPTIPSTLISTFISSGPAAAEPLTSPRQSAVLRKELTTYVAKPDPGPSFPYNLPFVPDLDKGHRSAASALAQCRYERQEMGAERRDNVRKRAKEITGEIDGDSQGPPDAV
ncbi:hypothetical protein NLJ89_g10814 [Agrocybe chaxingu]|uniref:Uncharacterized protein n=1 Tax=Agrocybe chaxingu TaxID=84603 RepID=A0A9W8MNK2_9AGAR|nr:hypothetical protein NLJ89_g10814 [Agrocybe chaxingu]